MADRPSAIVIDKRLAGLTTFQNTAKPLSALVYGAPGVGKTVLSGTAEDDARTAPVLYIDVENGWQSISWRQKAITMFPFRDFGKDANALKTYLLSYDDIPYHSIIVDSLTVLGDRCMEAIKAKHGVGIPSWEEWNEWTQNMRNFVGLLRDTKLHLIALATERDEKDRVVPNLQGKQIREALPGVFDTVARLTSVTVPTADGRDTEDRPRLLLRAGPKHMAKDRSDRFRLLPPVMDEPTVTKLLDRMEKGQQMAVDKAAERAVAR